MRGGPAASLTEFPHDLRIFPRIFLDRGRLRQRRLSGAGDGRGRGRPRSRSSPGGFRLLRLGDGRELGRDRGRGVGDRRRRHGSFRPFRRGRHIESRSHHDGRRALGLRKLLARGRLRSAPAEPGCGSGSRNQKQRDSAAERHSACLRPAAAARSGRRGPLPMRVFGHGGRRSGIGKRLSSPAQTLELQIDPLPSGMKRLPPPTRDGYDPSVVPSRRGSDPVRGDLDQTAKLAYPGQLPGMERMGDQGPRPDQDPGVRGAALQRIREPRGIVDFDGVGGKSRGRNGVGEAGGGNSLVAGMDDRNVGHVSLPKGG